MATSPTTHADVEIRTPDGVAPAYVARPASNEPAPAALLFMDAFGLRDAMKTMADRLASNGYYVLVPELFYRNLPYAPFDIATVFSSGGPELERLMGLIHALDEARITSDTGAYLDFIAKDPHARPGKVGAHGYCLGGGIAIAQACAYPDRIGAAASFHGGSMLVDPSMPKRITEKLRAPVYIAVAETDRRHTPEVTKALEAALTQAGVPHTIETYAGSSHGFAVPDHAVYDAPSAERHWAHLVAFYDERLA